MPARITLGAATRSLAIRTRPSATFQSQQIQRQSAVCQVGAQRWFAEEMKPQSHEAPAKEFGLDQSAQRAASESSAGVDAAFIQEVIAASTPAASSRNAQKREIFFRKSEEKLSQNAMALNVLQSVASGRAPVSQLDELEYRLRPAHLVRRKNHHTYELPALPLPSASHIKHRYDPVVSQVIGLIMQHGKLKAAQRNMGYILNFLRTASPPTVNPLKPLMPGAPPPGQLPLNPVMYLATAIDTIAPLVKIVQIKGGAGGGANLPVPTPLDKRVRRRMAIKWILDSVNKKETRGSGRNTFAHKFAEEIVAVVEGRSSAWDKRLILHKSGTTARANVFSKSGTKGRARF